MSFTCDFCSRGLSLRLRFGRVLAPRANMGAFLVRQPSSHTGVKSQANNGADMLEGHNEKHQETELLLPSSEAEKGLEDIKSQLSGLQDLVFKQQEVIINQGKELEYLKRRNSLGGSSGLSPLEAQTCSVGDKRLQGMFDARFHSLHG